MLNKTNTKKGESMKKYKFKGSETTNDLYDLEDKGIIEFNIYSDTYVEYLDAKIVYLGEDNAFYSQEKFDELTECQKNKVRARLDSDWAESIFGENYGLELNKARDTERSFDEVRA